MKHFKDYSLNHILSPKFSISYRRRGRTIIHPTQLDILAYGKEDEEEEVRSKLAKEGQSSLAQPTLTNYF